MDPLREIGGWDPYNVTEDADLGLRLHRHGYHSGIIAPPTLEDAPVSLRIWMAQRSRWFKGWLQTFLVLSREPLHLARDMGARKTLFAQILIAGMILSALGHPLLLAFLAFLVWATLTQQEAVGTLPVLLMTADIINIAGSYCLFLQLGRRRMSKAERVAIGWRAMLVPAYWLLQSAAAWRAINELRTRPFEWNKTPHLPAQTRTDF